MKTNTFSATVATIGLISGLASISISIIHHNLIFTFMAVFLFLLSGVAVGNVRTDRGQAPDWKNLPDRMYVYLETVTDDKTKENIHILKSAEEDGTISYFSLRSSSSLGVDKGAALKKTGDDILAM